MSRLRTTSLASAGALVVAAVVGWIFQDEIQLSGIGFATGRTERVFGSASG